MVAISNDGGDYRCYDGGHYCVQLEYLFGLHVPVCQVCHS